MWRRLQYHRSLSRQTSNDKTIIYFMTKKESRTGKPIKGLTVRLFIVAERVGFEPTDGCPSTDFESFPPCDFWWKLSEDGSTQRKPKSCGILRILASVFRFYLNPQGFPSSSHFCPELWPEDRTRIELDARLGVFTPIPFHENANHHFD